MTRPFVYVAKVIRFIFLKLPLSSKILPFISNILLIKSYLVYFVCTKGKPVEKQGRKVTDLRAYAYDSGTAVYCKGKCIRQVFHVLTVIYMYGFSNCSSIDMNLLYILNLCLNTKLI
jgi:hypothetical protein